MSTPKTGKNPKRIDPIAVLNEIASDPEAPATARVAAAKALLQVGRAQSIEDEPADDPITARALEILAGRIQ